MHPKSFRVQVMIPERVLYDGDVSMLTVPGTDGKFVVLHGHEPLIASLRAGMIVVCLKDSSEKIEIKISDSILSVKDNKCIVMAVSQLSVFGEEL